MTPARRSLVAAAPLLLAAAAPAPRLAAQAPADDPHAACVMTGWVPRGILARPVPLREGTGNTHDRATTASPDAQAFYNRGMSHLHGYVWIDDALAKDVGDVELWLVRGNADDAACAGSHYAAAFVARHKGDLAAAGREVAEAERLWRDADPGLARAERARVAAVPASGPVASRD